MQWFYAFLLIQDTRIGIIVLLIWRDIREIKSSFLINEGKNLGSLLNV
ncbi:unnamed protein product [Arabidopsis halleri]